MHDDLAALVELGDAKLTIVQLGDDELDVPSGLNVLGRYVGQLLKPVADACF